MSEQQQCEHGVIKGFCMTCFQTCLQSENEALRRLKAARDAESTLSVLIAAVREMAADAEDRFNALQAMAMNDNSIESLRVFAKASQLRMREHLDALQQAIGDK